MVLQSPARLGTGPGGGLWGITLIWGKVSEGSHTSLQIRGRREAFSLKGQAWALEKHLSTKKSIQKVPQLYHYWSWGSTGAPNLYKQRKTCTCLQEMAARGQGSSMARPMPRHRPCALAPSCLHPGTVQWGGKAQQDFWWRVGEGHGSSCLQLACPLVWKSRGR